MIKSSTSKRQRGPSRKNRVPAGERLPPRFAEAAVEREVRSGAERVANPPRLDERRQHARMVALG